MQTLKTIVATAVITLAATTVALAGAGRMSGQSPSAAMPVQAAVAYQQAQAGQAWHLSDAQIGQLASALRANAKAERKHERHTTQHQGQKEAQQTYANYRAPVRDAGDHSQTRTQAHTSVCTQHSGSSDRRCDWGSRECGGGCD
jgi:hypothetical protein